VLPPLVVTPSEIDEGLHRLDTALADLEAGKGTPS
jgi:acetylornithine/succinyldiaminopimelate/putrescine aminotransferase